MYVELCECVADVVPAESTALEKADETVALPGFFWVGEDFCFFPGCPETGFGGVEVAKLFVNGGVVDAALAEFLLKAVAAGGFAFGG